MTEGSHRGNRRALKTVAAFFALLSGAASTHAQSSVTIYGQLEPSGAMAFVKTPPGTPRRRITQLNPNTSASSIMGFRGREDLGDGLYALFNLEANAAVDTGGAGSPTAAAGTNPPNNTFFNRQSYVGLQSKFGAIKLGRSSAPTITTFVNVSSTKPSYNTGLVTTLASQGLSNDFYLNNMIKYESPDIYGFTAQALVAAGEVPLGARGGKSFGFSANYTLPDVLTITSAHHVDDDAVGHHLSWDDITAAVNVGRARLSGGFDRVRVPANLQSAAPAVFRDSKLLTFGGNYLLTDFLTLSAQYYEVRYTAPKSSSQQTVVSSSYSLSKRTSVYILGSVVHSGLVGVSVINGVAAFPNTTVKGYALGVNHIF